MEFLLDYAGFLAKTATVVLAIVAVLIVLAGLRRGRGKPGAVMCSYNRVNGDHS